MMRSAGRVAYKATGYKNPMKKGKLSSSRVLKQLPKLMTDVSRLKGIINSEKFRVESQPMDGVNIGQVNVNNSGHYLADWTPLPTQGDGYSNRQGNSIRWKSSHYSMLFQRQPNSVGSMTIQIELIKIIGEPYTSASNILGKYIEPNRWINTGTVYDVASDRKPEYFKQYRVLRKIVVKLPAVNYSGQTGAQQKIINFGVRLPNHHVKWNNNSNTLADGQVLCLIRCDTGNASQVTASTLDQIQNTGISTGVSVSCNKLDYYYDN